VNDNPERLYVGHFSFSIDSKTDPWHGFFTLVANAQSIEQALEKFRLLLIEIRKDKKRGVLSDVKEVYLDTCIEVSRIPEAGLMTYFDSMHGEQPGGINIGPIGAPDDEGTAEAYHLGPDDYEGTEQSGPVPSEPFLTFTDPQSPE
jgi:hypothetical protein